VQNLNWVLDSTIRALSQLVPATDLRSCLSAEEIMRIETKLQAYMDAEMERLQFSHAKPRPESSSLFGLLRAGGSNDYVYRGDTWMNIVAQRTHDREEKSRLLHTASIACA